MAPNTQVGRIIIEDPDNPNRKFSLFEHPDMYSNEDEEARYSRGGEFLENFMSCNVLEFCRRWCRLGDIHQVMNDIKEFYEVNAYRGIAIDADPKDAICISKERKVEAVEELDEIYGLESAIISYEELDNSYKEELIKEIRKGALL